VKKQLKIVIAVTVVGAGAWWLAYAAGNPDYQAKILNAPSSANRGQQISLTICTTNAATLEKALNYSTTRLYINTSSNITGSVELTNYTVLALLAKAYTNWPTSVTIPTNRPTGHNYLLAVCDTQNTVTESNENNNTNVWNITIN